MSTGKPVARNSRGDPRLKAQSITRRLLLFQIAYDFQNLSKTRKLHESRHETFPTFSKQSAQPPVPAANQKSNDNTRLMLKIVPLPYPIVIQRSRCQQARQSCAVRLRCAIAPCALCKTCAVACMGHCVHLTRTVRGITSPSPLCIMRLPGNLPCLEPFQYHSFRSENSFPPTCCCRLRRSPLLSPRRRG